MIKKIIHKVLNFILPQHCIDCHQSGELLCLKCAQKLSLEKDFSDKIWSLANYSNPIAKKAVWFLKYRGASGLAEPLADIISKYILNKSSANWAIIPVPLSQNRRRERGYNQSEIIAQFISQKTSLPIIIDVLFKKQDTPTQVSIKNRNKRLNNLAGVFEIKNKQKISGLNIYLIDDVYTTGTTMTECKKVLREAGAKKIQPLVIARG